MSHDKNQPARKDNVAAIVKYFTDGIKDSCDSVGIELEYTLAKTDGSPVSYSDDFGQRAMLYEMAKDYDDEILTSKGNLIGLLRKGESVTLEPGSQMEISAGPFKDLNEAKKSFDDFQSRLESLATPHDINVLAIGYHPTRRAETLELLPKPRYDLMNRYLGSISMYGICMMRGSASTQVSIDYSSIEDCLNKMRLANACVPMFSLMCDNSAIFEGKPRTHQLMRTEIWNRCDPDRCGIAPGVLDKGFTLADYAEHVLDTPAIVAKADSDKEVCRQTFGEAFASQAMTQQDVEHALSMMFTDVRLKKYIEIRPADAMPVDYAIAYAALIKGLFYSDDSLAALDKLLGNVSAADVTQAKAALMEDGYAAQVYGQPAASLAESLIEIASSGLAEDERALLAPLADLTARHTTLATITERTDSRG